MRILVVVLVCAFGCHSGVVETEIDDAVIVNHLLKIENPNYISIEEDGSRHYDSLKEHQDWARLYDKYHTRVTAGESADTAGVKYWLLLGFIARAENNAAISEAFSRDLIPSFEQDPNRYLETLRELPFLMPSTCFYLNNHFGFEDQNRDGKRKFLEANTDLVIEALGPEATELFMDCFGVEKQSDG